MIHWGDRMIIVLCFGFCYLAIANRDLLKMLLISKVLSFLFYLPKKEKNTLEDCLIFVRVTSLFKFGNSKLYRLAKIIFQDWVINHPVWWTFGQEKRSFFFHLNSIFLRHRHHHQSLSLSNWCSYPYATPNKSSPPSAITLLHHHHYHTLSHSHTPPSSPTTTIALAIIFQKSKVENGCST